MSIFNLVLCHSEDRKLHGLNAYHEVVETIFWGLGQLGHDVTYSVNNFATTSGATNIVFGAQVLTLDVLEAFPRNTVIYNFEQMRGPAPGMVPKQQYRYCAANFKIWDYSEANLQFWEALGGDAKIVPIGYAPVLSRIPKGSEQDIDVLIYGLPVENRLKAFDALCRAGFRTMFLCGFYGTKRDAMIARSKVVLNIQSYDWSRIFEIVRVSYLLANKKAVVADINPETYVEHDIRDGIKFSTLDEIVRHCQTLIEDDAMRSIIEERGFDAFSKRDIREILTAASISD